MALPTPPKPSSSTRRSARLSANSGAHRCFVLRAHERGQSSLDASVRASGELGGRGLVHRRGIREDAARREELRDALVADRLALHEPGAHAVEPVEHRRHRHVRRHDDVDARLAAPATPWPRRGARPRRAAARVGGELARSERTRRATGCLGSPFHVTGAGVPARCATRGDTLAASGARPQRRRRSWFPRSTTGRC